MRITYPFGLNPRVLPAVAPVIISPLTQGNQLVRLTFMKPMHYQLIINTEPKRKMHLLPKRLRKEIGYRIFLMQEDLAGDVKKLKGSRNEYRLRVGDYRITFELEGDTITIYDIGNRKDIYR